MHLRASQKRLLQLSKRISFAFEINSCRALSSTSEPEQLLAAASEPLSPTAKEASPPSRNRILLKERPRKFEDPENLIPDPKAPRRSYIEELISKSNAKSSRVGKVNLGRVGTKPLQEALEKWGIPWQALMPGEKRRQGSAVIQLVLEALLEEENQIPLAALASQFQGDVAASAQEGRDDSVDSTAEMEGAKPQTHANEANIKGRSQSAGAAEQDLSVKKLESLTPEQVAEWLREARTEDIAVLDVGKRCTFADHLVIATGRSKQHVQSAAYGLCYQISEKIEKYRDTGALYIEGGEDSDWIAIDTGTIVVHVLTRDARLNYDLEGLWDRRSAGRNTRADTEGETQLFA